MSIMLEKIIRESTAGKITLSHYVHKKKEFNYLHIPK